MKRILDELTCSCKKDFSVIKKRKATTSRPLKYPDLNEINSKTFQIKYTRKLSPVAILILNSFQRKYLYYAIDDILYVLKSNPMERDNLLALLYSPVLSLQNNFFINFFDIWIDEIYIQEKVKQNKFLSNDCPTTEQFYYITIKLFYKKRIPVQKPDVLW